MTRNHKMSSLPPPPPTSHTTSSSSSLSAIISATTTSTTKQNLGRYSYCDSTATAIKSNTLDKNKSINLILRSSSAEIVKKTDLENSKLSILTPSSPIRSPRYSLLVAETSSENSSSINTPTFDGDISSGNGLKQYETPFDHIQKGFNDAKDFNILTEDSLRNVSILFLFY